MICCSLWKKCAVIYDDDNNLQSANTHAATACSLRLGDHDHQVDYFVAMVHAGYVCVAIIHRTLTWTTGSLSCAQMLMHAIVHGGVRTPKESLH